MYGDTVMQREIDEIVSDYIERDMTLKEIYHDVYDMMKKSENEVIDEYVKSIRDEEDLNDEDIRRKLTNSMIVSGQRLGVQKILMITNAYERLTKSDKEDNE